MAKKTKPVTEIAIFSAVFAASLLLLHLFVGVPLIKASKQLKDDFKATQTQLQESENLIRTVPNPQKEIEEIQKKAEEFKAMEMNKKQIPRIISMLGGSVNQNITIMSLKPRDDIKSDNETLPEGVSKIYVEIVLNCSYQQFGEYLDTVLRLPMSFTIESISLQKKETAVINETTAKKPPEKQEKKTQELTVILLLSTYMVWQL